MKPVYFPYTYLAPSEADSLKALFTAVAVYQPAAGRMPEEMRGLVERGFLEVVVPATGDEVDFDRLIRDFHNWGRTHRDGAGLEAALFYGHPLWASAGADESTSEISSQLRRRLSPETAPRAVDAVLAARVFLQLAQAADEQRHQVADELSRYDRARAQLFEALTGEADPAASGFDPLKPSSQGDDGEDPLKPRMIAWARLFLSQPYPSPVFVTTRPALLRHLCETMPGCLRVSFHELSQAAGGLSVDQRLPADDIVSQLAALAAGRLSLPVGPIDGAEVKSAERGVEEACIYLWPEIPPLDFFSRLLPAAMPGARLPPSPAEWRHTLVVQVPSKTASDHVLPS
jgi:hypothetical protein